MRYFQTSNASRQYRFGGLAVSFEPVDQIGGLWLGVLPVEDDSMGNIIAENLPSNPQVTEITAEEYESLKKKPPTPLASLQVPRQSPPPRPLQNAALVGPGVAPTLETAGEVPVTSDPLVPEQSGVNLETKVLDIVDELKLVEGAKTLRE